MKKIISFVICICLFYVVNGVCARETSRDGGYIIGYPEGTSQSGQPRDYNAREQDRKAAIALPQTTFSDEEISEVGHEKKDRMIADLKKKLALKDKHIHVLEERVARLSSKLEGLEADRFMMHPEKGERYKVKKGDNLWKIAARKDIYGDPYMWITIYNANMSKIKDPNMIFPGQLFEIPK
jgi:nucleoid-associated protein YgaU